MVTRMVRAFERSNFAALLDRDRLLIPAS